MARRGAGRVTFSVNGDVTSVAPRQACRRDFAHSTLDLDQGLPRCFRALRGVSVRLDLDQGLPRCFRALRGVSVCLDLYRFIFFFFLIFFYGDITAVKHLENVKYNYWFTAKYLSLGRDTSAPIYFTVSICFRAEVSRPRLRYFAVNQ